MKYVQPVNSEMKYGEEYNYWKVEKEPKFSAY